MIFAIAAFLCLGALTFAADAAFVEVGTGTGASWYPTYGYYDYSYHGCIYYASDIGTSMDINKISYNVQDYSGYTNTEYTIYNQQIYMTHTTLTTFPDATLFDPNTMTLVYDGDVHWSGTVGIKGEDPRFEGVNLVYAYAEKRGCIQKSSRNCKTCINMDKCSIKKYIPSRIS